MYTIHLNYGIYAVTHAKVGYTHTHACVTFLEQLGGVSGMPEAEST